MITCKRTKAKEIQKKLMNLINLYEPPRNPDLVLKAGEFTELMQILWTNNLISRKKCKLFPKVDQI